MIRPAVLAFALVSAPAWASPQFHAQPASPPAEAQFVVRDTLWKCGGAGCAGGKSNSRPAIVCAALARKVGPLRSFSAAGRPLAPQELEKCNARAD